MRPPAHIFWEGVAAAAALALLYEYGDLVLVEQHGARVETFTVAPVAHRCAPWPLVDAFAEARA